jgi:hypothetical protein
MELARDIMKRCSELCPELGRPEDMQVISHNVGLRRMYTDFFTFPSSFSCPPLYLRKIMEQLGIRIEDLVLIYLTSISQRRRAHRARDTG